MKKIATSAFIVLALFGCRKADVKEEITNQVELEKKIINDFADVVVNPNYADLQLKTGILKSSTDFFINHPSDSALDAARMCWRNSREAWEKSEAFLFGPVEDFNYDPELDTWPLNTTDIDALLADSVSLNISTINSLSTSLKGFHAIEYMLFGIGSIA